MQDLRQTMEPTDFPGRQASMAAAPVCALRSRLTNSGIRQEPCGRTRNTEAGEEKEILKMSARRDDMQCNECGRPTNAIERLICSHCNSTVHSHGCGGQCRRCGRSFCNTCFSRHRCRGVGPYTPEMSSVQPPPTAQSSMQPPSASELAWKVSGLTTLRSLWEQ